MGGAGGSGTGGSGSDLGEGRSGPKPKEMTYAGSGVDVAAARHGIKEVAGRVRSTYGPEVIGDLGGFGALFRFDQSRYQDPVLVSAADGAGTKVLVAQELGVHNTVGIDLVAMSANDVAAMGATPLFFLDYVVMERFDDAVFASLIDGITEGCRQAECALIGGETAEHPGHLPEGSYDLAGFCVGVAERSSIIDGAKITPGDVLIGVGSSGVHSNGFSLIRRTLLAEVGPGERIPGLRGTVGEELMRPTLIYTKLVSKLAQEFDVRGLAHITGGGLPENVERILPEGLAATVDRSAWEVPSIFGVISETGNIPQDEMFSTFNMGIGMVAVVPASEAGSCIEVIKTSGFAAFQIGEVQADAGGERVKLP